MKKNGLFISAIILFLLMGASLAIAEGSLDVVQLPVGELTIAAPRGVVPRRSPVVFPHSKHFDYTCKTCHHEWNGHTRVSGCAASGCHDLISSPKGETPGTAARAEGERYFKTAYHKLCIGCHGSLKRKKRDMEYSKKVLTESPPKPGPTGCIHCHPGRLSGTASK